MSMGTAYTTATGTPKVMSEFLMQSMDVHPVSELACTVMQSRHTANLNIMSHVLHSGRAGPGKLFGIQPYQAINAGVALMRLERIRHSTWSADRDAIIAAHGDQLILGAPPDVQVMSHHCIVPSAWQLQSHIAI